MWAFQILLRAGCRIDLNTTNGDSLAHYAVKTVGNAPQFLRTLASKGADLRLKNNSGRTPLSIAEEKNQSRILATLKDLGINNTREAQAIEEKPARV